MKILQPTDLRSDDGMVARRGLRWYLRNELSSNCNNKIIKNFKSFKTFATYGNFINRGNCLYMLHAEQSRTVNENNKK